MEEGSRPRRGATWRSAPHDNRTISAAGLGLALIALVLAVPLASAKSTGGMVLVTGSSESSIVKPATALQPDAGAAAPVGAPVADAPASGGVRFGSRILRQGMVGEDVRVLNGIVRSQRYAKRVKVTSVFHAHTSSAVRRFQTDNSLRPSGIVDRRTAKALAGSMRRARTTWYGPGFYGNKTACGQTLTYGTVGVAHRNLPCGTKVTFRHKGRSLVAEVIDRGPFVRGIMWDLTGAAARGLNFSGSGPIRYAVAR